eukprot:CAMPEP_0177672320 /NCGR_PEP_ID=MMETSP0447-20121125/25259_1 /TAXON_ID=0 /ORGANISM="Stygamoeba regulata, Strain BSH-02190019" /LENGTH=143 /DNA_ID=CAMNT_0019179941 /DNA_START=134 /DNA_END=565 /DNA_ORIENTATION=-
MERSKQCHAAEAEEGRAAPLPQLQTRTSARGRGGRGVCAHHCLLRVDERHELLFRGGACLATLRIPGRLAHSFVDCGSLQLCARVKGAARRRHGLLQEPLGVVHVIDLRVQRAQQQLVPRHQLHAQRVALTKLQGCAKTLPRF